MFETIALGSVATVIALVWFGIRVGRSMERNAVVEIKTEHREKENEALRSEIESISRAEEIRRETADAHRAGVRPAGLSKFDIQDD